MTSPENARPADAMPPAVVLRQLINSGQITQMIYVVAKLGIADLLADGPRTSSDLAQTTGTQPQALYRVLRGLASIGIFAEDEEGRFSLTPLAQPLRTGVPISLHASAIWTGDPRVWGMWASLLHTVTTGEDAPRHLYGMNSWEHLAQNPDLHAVFDEFMTQNSGVELAAILAAYDFSGMQKIVDVGGGQGMLVSAVLNANPALNGILFDQPDVVLSAQGVLEAAGVAARCQVVGGDMFASMPEGGDIYVLKHVLHDWTDERSVSILKNIRKAIKPEGKVLVIEFVVPPGNQPDTSKMLDMVMLLLLDGGRERRADEFQAILESAGFKLNRVIPTRAGIGLVEAVPV